MSFRTGGVLLANLVRRYSGTAGKDVRRYSEAASKDVLHYKLVIAGGGTGGVSVAARACRALGPSNVAVIEPSMYHYNQAMWTLVGGGIKQIDQSAMPTEDVLPRSCHFHRTHVTEFSPDKNTITLGNGKKVTYEYLVIALGLQINPNGVGGLKEALNDDNTVCSNYMRSTVVKTFPAIHSFKGGNAIFTVPNTPIKCGGAPQKIMYLADEYWRNHGVRDKTKILFNSALPAIYHVPRYAEKLAELVERKGIKPTYMRNLTAVDHTRKQATFDVLDGDKEQKETYQYDFMHVTPPMSAPDVLKNSTSPIVDENGYLDVNKHTLQHKKYPNIFGIGDCTNIPTSKTAAAVASQNKILATSLRQVMFGQAPNGQYDGYTACPLVTGYKKCILAEFDFDLQPLETFPFDQRKERRSMFYLKKYGMPEVYWRKFVKYDYEPWHQITLHDGCATSMDPAQPSACASAQSYQDPYCPLKASVIFM